ncbi:5'-methylthioadenosine/S-adenosylhomocysteine nucleosidase [Micromonospora sp. WMMA1949]|uniref:5'-methylthioadenosine/S-adenosylhomocysteine nucleosidase n=1 Tax=Micromonospora sp. WMMA1949 TaxID=3015162 RepID=UPI0022B6BBA9|nr:5'-methylthioadenosine/S-adenosylhomocysteine nucleosidase [Micromonospora sp. WMMA1949]MCZ7424116.1 5'-methylthioadenosine/S-adenosylhomocysteine nucleosidase [Micromonospora sp. WMMA1949]
MSTQDSADVVVLAALPLEYDAVRKHLQNLTRSSHPATGTQFEVGSLPGGPSRVAIAVLGPGTTDAALLAGQAIESFDPRAILFVGIAGALHDDLQLSDVVAATKVYSYHGGSVTDDGFRARPRSYDADHELLQRAYAVAREQFSGPSNPKIHFRPVAAGEVVLNSRTQPLADQLRTHYNDAAAIEMESAGMARAGHMHRKPTLTVRGISDRADGAKAIVDAAGWQPRAARHAADFAMAVIADFLSAPPSSIGRRPERAGSPSSIQNINAFGAPAYGALHGDVYVHEGERPSTPEWRTVSRPLEVAWRSRITRSTLSFEPSTLEVHLVPATQAPYIEVRRLASLADELATHLPARVAVETDVDDRGARAVSTDHRAGPEGLFLGRNGQRSAWKPLPRDTMGALLDESWLTDHLAALITTLIRFSLPHAARYAPALAVSPANMVTIGRADQLSRTQASGFLIRDKLEVPPEESVPADDLDSLASEVAAELTARLLLAFRQSNR